ncbi:MAG: hypothetical protein ACYSTY_00575, partial [Planctomycetota bacterium]
ATHGRRGAAWMVAAAGLAVIAAGTTFGSRLAFPRYRMGCHNCHGAFGDNTSPKDTVFPGPSGGSKHFMHRNPTAMNTHCDLCHSTGDDDGGQRNPYTYFSDGTGNNPGSGCTGCHGRDYGGERGDSAAGLRAHHTAHGVVECGFCHIDDPPPLPERFKPTYYGTPDTNVDDPCNSAPDHLENWSLDTTNTEGLDNDSDDIYDGADPDCSCPTDVNGDGTTNVLDLIPLLLCFGNPTLPGCAAEDINADGFVNVVDLIDLLLQFGDPCP